jgi:hypothetical protein
MKSVNIWEEKDLSPDIQLDDQHAHILIKYDSKITSLEELIKTIELTGTKVLQITELQTKSPKNKSTLFKLESQDVKEIILNLSKYPLIGVTGYNSKPKLTE